MYSFKNIDDYTPGYFERVGTLKGKRWYSQQGKTGLFKPRRFEHGDRKVFCANHYGEFMGYVLAKAIDIDACPVELAHLTKFYEHYFKFKYNGTPIPRDGAITYKVGPRSATIQPGKIVISKYLDSTKDPSKLYSNRINDKIPTIMCAISSTTKDFYEERGYSPRMVKAEVERNIIDAAKMIIYDAAFGNNDRHDENWSMLITDTDFRVYPLYDNERVLGLCENQKIVEALVNNPKAISSYNDNHLKSRMYPGNKESATFRDVLEYMMTVYPSITREMLEKITSKVKPQDIKDTLKSMEGLPEEYADFSSQLYSERFKYMEMMLNREKGKRQSFYKDSFKNELLSKPRKVTPFPNPYIHRNDRYPDYEAK